MNSVFRGLVAALLLNSLYLAVVSALEAAFGRPLQSPTYLWQFLAHLALGSLLAAPMLLRAFRHGRTKNIEPASGTKRWGQFALLGLCLCVLSGLTLVLWAVSDAPLDGVRLLLYGSHLFGGAVLVLAFIFHRRRTALSARWVGAVGLVTLVLALSHLPPFSSSAPTSELSEDEQRPFFPALTLIDGEPEFESTELMRDGECQRCHEDSHRQWSMSAHRFSSFNNPAYLASVRASRAHFMERDGNLEAVQFCAGCHDPVPMLTGSVTDEQFDFGSPEASAGVTCMTCHSITRVNSNRGNADYTIGHVDRYPFADSNWSPLLWVHDRLVRAKPGHHKRTFLKPVHKSPEFCGTCHKVRIPKVVNAYRSLRGQNHLDSFSLSGVSGGGASSFRYPERARSSCNACHMPFEPSMQLGSFVSDGKRVVHDHQFPGANTALSHFFDLSPVALAKQREFLKTAIRLDVTAIREGDDLSAKPVFLAAVEPVLVPGRSYVLDVVVSTVGMGHAFTQGTADSNQVWLETQLRVNLATFIHRAVGERPVLISECVAPQLSS
ncbi:MAG: multiheme c-type cytochrome [Myxococcota bacterium]